MISGGSMWKGGWGSAVLSVGNIQRSFWGVGSICAFFESSFSALYATWAVPVGLAVSCGHHLWGTEKNDRCVKKLAYICVYIYIYIYIYTECNSRNGPDFGRVFLRSYYTDITQNTYIQSSMVTEVLAREVWNFDNYYSLIDYQIHVETGRNMWFL